MNLLQNHNLISQIQVEFSDSDRVTVEHWQNSQNSSQWVWKIFACAKLSTLIHEKIKKEGRDPSQWQLPAGTEHEEILVRELIRKAQGQFKPPYEHEELCHCRMVSTTKVVQAIKAGAHDSGQVKNFTTAGGSCGVCKMDTDKLIKYYLTNETEIKA